MTEEARKNFRFNRHEVHVKGPGDDDRMVHEQEFFCVDFTDAKERAMRHADKMKKLWPGYKVYVIDCPVAP